MVKTKFVLILLNINIMSFQVRHRDSSKQDGVTAAGTKSAGKNIEYGEITTTSTFFELIQLLI